MKRVEVHKYKTPLDGNIDCPWSLGVLNLTEAGCSIIAQFANGIRSVNSPRAMGMTATDMRERTVVPRWASEMRDKYRTETFYEAGRAERDALVKAAYDAEMSAPLDRSAWMAGDFDEPEKKPEPKPEAPRNRFSGLDIE